MCSNKKMELNEAIEIVLNNTKRCNDAYECIQCNKLEGSRILIKRLDYAISNIENQKEDIMNINIRELLFLLAKLEVKEAFPYLIKVLKFKDKNIFFETVNIPYPVYGNIFLKIISDENDIKMLKQYITNQNILVENKLVAYYIIDAFYQTNNRRGDLESFYKDIICNFIDNNFDYWKDHILLMIVINSSIHNNFINILKDIKMLLIKLVIKSEIGYNFSGFKDYFKFLYIIDPLIAGKINDVKEYIKNLKYCTDKEIFQYDELIDIGKFLFCKVLNSGKEVNNEIVKIAIKQLNYYPLNERRVPCTDEQYYKEICDYLKIVKIPKAQYSKAKEWFCDIFEIKYSRLKDSIYNLIKETDKQHKEIEEELKEIISKSNKDASLQKNIKENIWRIVQNNFRQKELYALYKNDNSNESGLLVFYLKEIQGFFSLFCEDINNEEKVDEKLREISMKCLEQDQRIVDIFEKYRIVIEQFDFLIDETPYLTLYNIFYKVKFLPVEEKIELEFKQKINITKNYNYKNIKNDLEAEIKKHPLNPIALIDCYNNDISKYCSLLENYSTEIISDIKENISNSICLSKRKSLIEHCLFQIENNNYELAINLLPVQIEGLFADLLEYSTIKECIDDIKQYKTILNLELVKKIGFGIDKNINISFDTIAYFKYYFNSIVRNTVAHGNYELLIANRGIHKDICIDDDSKDIDKKIIMFELLFDLNYLVCKISKINEIDTANGYINNAYESFSLSIKEGNKEEFYECMISDLNGTRQRINLSGYKTGIFVTYEPIQLVYWIFNPYYEEYLNSRNLTSIRKILHSYDFWEYLKNKISNNNFKKEKIDLVIKKMFKLDIEDEVKKILGEILNQLKTLD